MQVAQKLEQSFLYYPKIRFFCGDFDALKMNRLFDKKKKKTELWKKVKNIQTRKILQGTSKAIGNIYFRPKHAKENN